MKSNLIFFALTFSGTATIERRKEPETRSTKEDEDNNNIKDDNKSDEEKEEEKDNKPPKAPEFVRPSRTPPRDRDPKSPSPSDRATSPNRGLGDLATIIAAKALQRQRTYEGNIEQDSKGPKGQKKVYGASQGGNTKLSNGIPGVDNVDSGNSNENNGQGNIFQRFSRSQSNRSIEISGATLDSSQTEPMSPNRNGQNKSNSVLARTKMFESQGNTIGSYKAKSVSRESTPESRTDLPFDLPPPLIEGNHRNNNTYSTSVSSNYDRLTPRRTGDSDVIANRNNFNGHETVGWVINSSPPKHSHEYAMRSKLANRNGGLGGHVGIDASGADNVGQMALVDDHMETSALADIVEVEFIPPPPLFDSEGDSLGPGVGSPSHFQPAFSHEDNASMVSSLSTLSTLSSSEQDHHSFHHGESPRQSFGHVHQSQLHSQSSSASSAYHSASTSQSEDLYSDVAPPPGFDIGPPAGFEDPSFGVPMDYGHIEQENHYEELGVIQEFIPPPTAFDINSQQNQPLVTSLRQARKQSPRHAFEEKHIESWSNSDVMDWLDSLQLNSHKANFARHQVTGRNLTQMGRNELIALGVTQVGDRMNIERAVKRALMNR